MTLQFNFSDLAETKLYSSITYGWNQVQSNSRSNKRSLFKHCSDLQII